MIGYTARCELERFAASATSGIDLTVLSDDEIIQHGLTSLMEMLFKHYYDKDFLSKIRQLLKIKLVRKVVRKLNVTYLADMLKYIENAGRCGKDLQATQYLIQELIVAFPEKKARKTIMTFTFGELLKEYYKEEALKQKMLAKVNNAKL